jgi:hypothetical protein
MPIAEGAETVARQVHRVQRHAAGRVDRLFGVRMAERGVSQLVTVDFAGASRMPKTA